MMQGHAEPEREMVRRIVPFAVPATGAALLIGGLAAGWPVGWSAALGVAVVFANVVAHGLSLAWAARISLQMLYGVAMVGFVVRMALITGLLFGLDRLAWFSPLAFGLAVVPGTLLLLVFEMKLLAGGVGRELQLAGERKEVAG